MNMEIICPTDSRCNRKHKHNDPICDACLANQKEADISLEAERQAEKSRRAKRLQDKNAHRKADNES